MTTDGVLVVAVAFKKEYLAVPLEDFPLNDEKWHSIEIVHSKVPIDSHLKHESGPFQKVPTLFR